MTSNSDDLNKIGARVYGYGGREMDEIGARVYGRTPGGNDLDQIGARVYGYNDESNALGHRVYHPTRGEVVSYQQDDPADEVDESRPWRLDEVRPGPGAKYNFDAIGARIASRRGGPEVFKTVDNRGEIDQVAGPYPYAN